MISLGTARFNGCCSDRQVQTGHMVCSYTLQHTFALHGCWKHAFDVVAGAGPNGQQLPEARLESDLAAAIASSMAFDKVTVLLCQYCQLVE